MKYNRKAVVAAIVKVQAEKFKEERTKLKAEEPILKNKLIKAAANFVSKLTKEQLIKGLGAATRTACLYIDKNHGKPTYASFSLTIHSDEKTDKALSELAAAYDAYHGVDDRIRKINFYLDYDYKYGDCSNLIEKVKRDAPYDYELQADELLKNPELATDIEALRKDIFKD